MRIGGWGGGVSFSLAPGVGGGSGSVSGEHRSSAAWAETRGMLLCGAVLTETCERKRRDDDDDDGGGGTRRMLGASNAGGVQHFGLRVLPIRRFSLGSPAF